MGLAPADVAVSAARGRGGARERQRQGRRRTPFQGLTEEPVIGAFLVHNRGTARSVRQTTRRVWVGTGPFHTLLLREKNADSTLRGAQLRRNVNPV